MGLGALVRAAVVGRLLAFELVTPKGFGKMPWAAGPTAEMIEAHQKWPAAVGATVEFVHIHKCGGLTFNAVVPRVICGAGSKCLGGFNAVQWQSLRAAPCCVVRPDDIASRLAELAARYATPPRFVSSRDEASAFSLPWKRGKTFKAVMVREPYARWVSEQQYRCRQDGAKPVNVAPVLRRGKPPKDAPNAAEDTWAWRSTVRNRIAEGVVPLDVLGKSAETGAPLDGARLDAAKHALYAFAFVGVVEEYERSMCLFARTFEGNETAVVCEFCCVHMPNAEARAENTEARADGRRAKAGAPHVDSAVPRVNAAVPRVNAAAATDDGACRAAVTLTDADADAYAESHAADRAVYAAARAIFDARWAAAARWGPTAGACGCRFMGPPTGDDSGAGRRTSHPAASTPLWAEEIEGMPVGQTSTNLGRGGLLALAAFALVQRHLRSRKQSPAV
ncbi:hypothetical protein M885DRAFT_550502 [Pelagophyceae sp. CCMP2097]|nr:hypothetical protein M885DRAFT_550502 [Pelagophyceae sp. CCMP2097]